MGVEVLLEVENEEARNSTVKIMAANRRNLGFTGSLSKKLGS
jgi:hypothetical protein